MASTPEDLFAAIVGDDVERVREIVGEDPMLARSRDDAGVSALMSARYRMDRALTEPILRAAGPLDVFEAAAFGDMDRLTEVLQADPGAVSARSRDGFTALHFSAFFGGADVTRLLLARGAEVDASGRGWMTGTALHSAASASQVDSALALLHAGADPNARQGQGWTPLHSAAANGRTDLVRALRAHGADPAAVNDDGKTPGDVAEDDATRAALA
ncbi:MAG: ankyrin repeat domain-containing protein [Actinomycetota bacterium]